jgi:hypothetical protein
MISYKEARSVLNKHKKRDNWFLDDYSVNPYEVVVSIALKVMYTEANTKRISQKIC